MNFPSAAVGQQGKCSGCKQTVRILPDLRSTARNPDAKKKVIILAAVAASALGVVILCISGSLLVYFLSQEDRVTDSIDAERHFQPSSEISVLEKSNQRLTKVSGVVTYDGKPLGGATITILPDGGGGRDETTSTSPRPASGKSDAGGKFNLTTTFPDGSNIDGAVEGAYIICIIKFEQIEVEERDRGEPPADGFDPSAEMLSMMDDNLNGGAKSLINEKFGLTFVNDNAWSNKCSVGAIDYPTTINITLTSDGRGIVVVVTE